MSKIIHGLAITIIAGAVTIAVALTGSAPKAQLQEIKPVTLVTVTTPNKDSDKQIYSFSDGSAVVISETAGVFEFFPVEMGDWSYELDSLDQLKKAVTTYVTNKNDILLNN